jgi:Fic family protein
LKTQDFTSIRAGKVLLQDRGYHAYIPNDLPPKVKLSWQLARAISKADQLLSELNGLGASLLNPDLLAAPSIRKEAVLSSKIENTQTEIEDLYFFEADRSEQTGDVKEVANYMSALKHGLAKLDQLPLCSRLMLEMHEILMGGVRGSQFRGGEYRTTQNWIGPAGCTLKDATYVPPPPNLLADKISNFEHYLNEMDPDEPALVRCAVAHYQFEAIHPFADGNGRIGRLLITLFLCSKGYLNKPMLYLSGFFEKHRSEYYRLLLQTSQKGDWESWINYFLNGVSTQANFAVIQARSLLELHQAYKVKIGTKRVPEAARRLIEHIFVNPIVQPAALAKEWDMSFPTVSTGIEHLVKLGILAELTGNKRNRYFRANQILGIINAPN